MQTLHDETLKDDYFWMRERNNPKVRAFLEAENAYADAFMKPTEAFQKTLYDEMLGRIKETDLSVPYRDGGWYYYSRTEKGKQYPIYCRKKGSVEAPEEVYLDVNALAEGEKFMSVGVREVSDDGNLLAYTTDNTGFRDYTLWIKNLATGKLFPEKVARVSSVAWAADNKTLFYTSTDPAKRPYRLYRHALGSDPSTDALLYEEKDEMFRVFALLSRSKAFVLVGAGSHTAQRVAVPPGRPAGGGAAPDLPAREGPRVLRGPPRRLLLHPHEQGLPQFPRRHGAGRRSRPGELEGVLPCRGDVMVEDIDLFADYAVFSEREDGLPRLRVTDFKTGASYRVEFPEAIYAAYLTNNVEFRTDRLSRSTTSPSRRRRRSTTSTWRRKSESS